MKKDIITILGCGLMFLYVLCYTTIFPYIAVRKVEKGELKIACAYVTGKQKAKHSDDTIIRIDNRDYISREILPLQNKGYIHREKWLKFPLGKDIKDFLTVSPKACKLITYVEVYHVFDFKKIYLYEYIQDK